MRASRHVVLVIDVQQGLCDGEDAAFDCAATIARINRVIHEGRRTGAPIVFVQHESTSGFLTRDSAAWQLARGLDARAEDSRVYKTTPDAFLGTELEAMLRSVAIDELVVCGMHTEFCVDTTTRRALALGFPVVLIADGHTSAGNEALTPAQVIAHHNATLTNIASFGPRARAVRAADLDLSARDGFRTAGVRT